MVRKKRSRKGRKSVSTIIKQEDDSENSQERTSGLYQSNVWIQDFDMQFTTRLSKFDDILVKKLKATEWHYASERMKIRPGIGNNKLVVEDNGEFNSNDTTVMESSVQEADTALKSRHRKKTRCGTVTSSTVPTELRRVTRSISLNSKDRMPEPMAVATVSKFKTPACKSTFASAPSLITPKVAPNAPLSMVRHPRQGELAVSLSGSPLIVSSTLHEQNANVNLRLANGTVVSILPEPNLRPYDIPQVDEETRQQLQTLREHMKALINMTHY
ncbi:borealin [Zootermopsis nevadensis]|uniref:Borealin n=1 Tax=Zootermopsis nevadensis TaxID=136037 RepID=A0A067RCH5_ZOONE|nr:borealin [Zootermopsis nevadensis]XP_021923583.1 borealin [Zootermopsis nevadensis]XP_021923584.1 borealin [Zootermopsis nevadensis]XP_021923585.1 borealin [Zootermopsis nevadensis]KDR17589.1 Borealin [Zootermopsis nevadensis]